MNIHTHLSTSVELIPEISYNPSNFASKYFDVFTFHSSVHFLISKSSMCTGANVAVIEIGKGVILFDTFVSPEANQDLHNFIHNSLNKPIQCVVNSHHHLEHTLGNYSIDHATPIIGGPKTLEKLTQEGFAVMDSWKEEMHECYSDFVQHYVQAEDEFLLQQMHEDLRLFQRMESPSFTLRAPSMIFSDNLRIPGSNFNVELHNLGEGHSSEDIVAIIPELKIGLLGDLICTNYQDPEVLWYAIHRAKSSKKIISHINWLLSQDLDTFLVGHGEPITKSELMEFKEQLISAQEK